MQFRDLGAQYDALKEDIDNGIRSVIENHNFILGSQVTELEEKLAKYVGVKHCVACASGTDALILPLMAWKIGEGDAVFAPDFTYFATVNSEMLRGATPILIDIDSDTFNMSPDALEKAIVKTLEEGRLTPKVIIPVDLFGQCADYSRICAIAKKYNLLILEDGAQGFGGLSNGKRACSFGAVGATSFFPAKPLGCYGDGGAMFTDDDEMDQVLRSLRAQGKAPEDKYDNREIGLNSRLDTMQAAILLPKFKAFCEYELDDINKVARLYTEKLEGYVKTPVVKEGNLSSWAQYTILLDNEEQRLEVQQGLKSAGIPSMIYYPRGMHQQTAITKYGYGQGVFPNTEDIVKRCLALPIHPYMSEKDVELVVCEVKKFL